MIQELLNNSGLWLLGGIIVCAFIFLKVLDHTKSNNKIK